MANRRASSRKARSAYPGPLKNATPWAVPALRYAAAGMTPSGDQIVWQIFSMRAATAFSASATPSPGGGGGAFWGPS